MQIALVTGGAGVEFLDEVDRPLTEALVERGATVHHPRWNDEAVDWSVFDVAVVRTTWDYWSQRDAFVTWAEHAAKDTLVLNPPDVLRWNTHKSYLIELEDRGAPVIPTAWLGQGDDIDLAALLQRRDWPEAVVKPAVSGASDGLVRVDARLEAATGDAAKPAAGSVAKGEAWHVYGIGEAAAVDTAAGQRHLDGLLAQGDALVQPYFATIETDGELSIVVIDGEVSHAVRKRPGSGEYRIQEEFGGRYEVEEPDEDTTRLAQWVVESTGADLLIARVDLLADESGAWQLTELEATEPDLYFRVLPAAAARLADAIVRRVKTAA